MKSAVRVNRVVDEYDEANTLKDTGFAVGRGGIVGFVAPDGTEKTTMIIITTGIMPPTEGRADVKDYGITSRYLETSKEEA